MLRNSRNRGIVKTIVLIIVALILLKYFFNITFYDIIHNQVVSEIWGLIKQIFSLLWQVVLLLLDFLKQILNAAQGAVSSIKSK